MDDDKIKKIIKIERIVSVVIIFLGVFLIEVNEDIATLLFVLGVLSIIYSPKVTKKIFNIREEKTKKIYINNTDAQVFKKYSSYFYKCVSNALVENKKIYSELNDFRFPKFKIEDIALKIYYDIKNQEMDPFIFSIDYEYFEKFLKKESNSESYKYFKNKMFKYFGKGSLKDKQELFNNNMTQIALSIRNLTDAKLYNNCIANYESEKEFYGVNTKNGDNAQYFEKEIRKYYFYFIDSYVSATLIAYLMFLSKKVENIDYNDEFIKIILKMINDVKDREVVYTKLYELYKELYSVDYSYIGNENRLKVFVNIIDDLKNNVISSKEKEIININVDERVVDQKNAFAQEIKMMLLRLSDYNELYDDNKIKALIIEKIKNINMISIKELFELLSDMNDFVEYYNNYVKKNRLKREKEKYLNGDFTSHKENADIKNDYYNVQTGTEFEKYLVNLFKRCGYEAKHTGKAGDQGCDLIVKKNSYTYCVQAKFYSHTLDNSPVQEIVGALKIYKGDRGVVITNADFSAGAKELARSNNVILIDGEKLERIIDYLLNNNDSNKDILSEIESI